MDTTHRLTNRLQALLDAVLAPFHFVRDLVVAIHATLIQLDHSRNGYSGSVMA